MSPPPPSPRWLRALLLVLALLPTLGPLAGVAPFRGVEARLYDGLLVPLLPDAPTLDRIVIVEVDDRTLAELGERWPLDRRTWARFFKRLASFGPEAVAVDVMFDQPAPEDVRVLASEVRARLEATPHAGSDAARAVLTMLDDAARGLNADQQLAEALAGLGEVTLGAILANASPFPEGGVTLEPVAKGVGALALEARGVTVSTPRLFLSARAHGAMNVLADPDSVVRRYPYVISKDGDGFASLALAVRLSDLDVAREAPIVERLLAADRGAPYLRYRRHEEGLSPWPRLSLSDVLLAGDDAASIDRLVRGRYVFVGATAPGIEDLIRTPLAWGRAGVEVHATALENLLLESWLEREGGAAWVSLALSAFLLGAFAVLLERRPRVRVMALLGSALLVIELGLAVAAAHGGGILVALVPVPLGLVALAVAEGLHRWLWTRREQERLLERERLLEIERAGLERLRSVVEHVGDAIVSVDGAEVIRWMNPAAESLFQRRARTAVNRPVRELLAHFERAPGTGDVLTGEAKVGEGTVPVEATATAMSIGGERFTNFVFRDVAARKALERQRDEFIAHINHELRTPLTSILGSLRLVCAGAVGEVPDKARELLEIAEKNGELLLSLVSDLLDSAKIEAGRLTLQTRPMPVGELLAEAVQRHSGFGVRYGVTLEASPLPEDLAHASVDIDKERIIQVVGNLVSNAVKHSPRGEQVSVGIRAGDGVGRVRVSVSDKGPGIPPEFHDQLFERFTMTIASDGKRRSGTGLGLAIARGIVEAHRGAIGFDTAVGGGTTFWFELPCLC